MFHLFQRPQRRRVRHGMSRPLRLGWLRPAALAALLGGVCSLGGLAPDSSLPYVAAQPQMVQPAPVNPQELPLDAPLRMIAEARQVYAQVQDYQCILITQERVKGKLLPEQVIQMSFRKQPFSVYMKWIGKEQTNQEVAFVAGKNDNKMKVLPSGIGRNFGWLKIALDDPKVMQHSRHQLNEAGFGNMLERCAKCWEAERQANKTKVQIAEYEYNQRRCIRVESTHAVKDASSYCHRCVLFFDKETRLPVRMECYDWPRQGGPPEGDLLECFSYINIQFNAGLQDAVFNH